MNHAQAAVKKMRDAGSSVFASTPYETLALSSIVTSMTGQKIEPEGISRVLCMCYDLKDVKGYLKLPETINLRARYHFPIDVVGHNTDNVSAEGLDAIRFFPTDKRLTTHETLIFLEGLPSLVWYEPSHPGKNLFLDGGYLIKPANESVAKVLYHFRELNPESVPFLQ